ncbi:MAG: cytochrome P450 [Silicimonas sp.]|nr:cytochrome P450 [Silicimonas sp.]
MMAQPAPVDDLTTLEMLDRDPAAVYRRLRREMPIARIAAIDRVVLTKADDAHLAKTDTAHFGSSDSTTPMQRAFGGHTLMRKDGAEHLCERAAMSGAFFERHLSGVWAAQAEEIADAVIGALPADGRVDLREALAVPLAAEFLSRVLGVGPEAVDRLFTWASALITGAMNAGFDPDIFAVSDRANEEMNRCFDHMIAHRRSQPDGSVLSTMVNAPTPLPLSQIRTNMKICIGGAIVETRDALLTMLHGLLSHPDQLRHCIATGRWMAAIEEGLRWVAPIQASPRIVQKPLVLRGIVLPVGETIMVVQGSANHDEDYWRDPHLFDIHRARVAHQSFGLGPHRCMGGDIYRCLVAAVLPRLFDRFPGLVADPAGEVTFRGFAFRGPTALPVRLV